MLYFNAENCHKLESTCTKSIHFNKSYVYGVQSSHFQINPIKSVNILKNTE